MKRQIIKTKPLRPYRVARIVIIAAVVVALAVVAYLTWERARPSHALDVTRTIARQDLIFAPMNPQSPVILI